MVAATRMITKEDLLNAALKKKKRGRPTVLDTEDIRASLHRRESFRQAVNSKYSIIGGAIVANEIGDDDYKQIFDDHKGGFRYQGVLEQIGRMYTDDAFDQDDLKEFIEIAISEILNGTKSRDLEKLLRATRIKVKQNRNA